MKRFIRWLHQYIGGYYIKHHVLTQSGLIAARQLQLFRRYLDRPNENVRYLTLTCFGFNSMVWLSGVTAISTF